MAGYKVDRCEQKCNYKFLFLSDSIVLNFSIHNTDCLVKIESFDQAPIAKNENRGWKVNYDYGKEKEERFTRYYAKL